MFRSVVVARQSMREEPRAMSSGPSISLTRNALPVRAGYLAGP